jgi:hypothetical protein
MTQPHASVPIVRTVDAFKDAAVGDLNLNLDHAKALARVGFVSFVLGALALSALAVRVSSDRLTQDIRTYEHQTRLALATRRQLQLDLATRASHARLEAVATSMGLVPATVEAIQQERTP